MALCVFLRGCSGFFQLIDDGLQLGAVSCDHTLLRIRDFDDDGHFVAVAGKQGLAALELGDAADLRAGEFQNVLDVFRVGKVDVMYAVYALGQTCAGVGNNVLVWLLGATRVAGIAVFNDEIGVQIDNRLAIDSVEGNVDKHLVVHRVAVPGVAVLVDIGFIKGIEPEFVKVVKELLLGVSEGVVVESDLVIKLVFLKIILIRGNEG